MVEALTLLRFRVANHRSIRDEQELSLVAVPRRGASAQALDTVRVAGIYGANASGKSNILSALEWMLRAIRSSHTSWQPDGGVPRQPFSLDSSFRERTSAFELDVLFGGTRYTYGFEVDGDTVRSESLHYYPASRRVRLFERTNVSDYRFGRALLGEREQIRRLTRRNSLFLSSAASNNHPLLGRLYKALNFVRFAAQNDIDETSRALFSGMLMKEPARRRSIEQLLRVADLGVGGVRLRRTADPDLSVSQLREALAKDGYPDVDVEFIREAMETVVELEHSGANEATSLLLADESAGTRTWLAILGPLLLVLERGDPLCIDEIDSSLHPLLSSTLIRLFKDPEVNPRGAQLVFASHDTTLLGTMLEDALLDRDEVWFTEKDTDGATSLFSLAEFAPRREENVERGYLQGRYGAVPYISYDQVRAALVGVGSEAAE